ncbi:MAG: hypothetical protein QXZ01_03430 [Candidatus Micrarchaeaceae archaeon]
MEGSGYYAIVEFYQNEEPSPQYEIVQGVVPESLSIARVIRTEKIEYGYGSLTYTPPKPNSFVAFFHPKKILAYTTPWKNAEKDLLMLYGTISGLANDVEVSIWAPKDSEALKAIYDIVRYSLENGSPCDMRLLLTTNIKDAKIFYNHNIGYSDKNVLLIYTTMKAVLKAFEVSQLTIDHFAKPPQQSNLDDFLSMKRGEKRLKLSRV